MSEPKRYAWMRDGLLVAGTLQNWTHMWEGDHYAGDNDLSPELLYWDGKETPAIHLVYIKRGETTENEYIPYEIHCNGELAHVFIDGRA